MKHYNKATFKRNRVIKYTLAVGLMLGVVGAGSLFLDLYASIGNFGMETKPDPATFKTADEDFLAQTAYNFDHRYALYHHPMNQSSTTYFHNDSLSNGGLISYTNVSSYHFSDNEALWTGLDYTGWTYKYLVAKQKQNATMEQFSLDVLINLTTGLSMLMAVPNGGLGPEYGGILARGFAPPDAKEIWPDIFTDAPKHFNGTGLYKEWRYRAYTSNDEYGGYYLFLAIATKYLQHIEFIKDRVSLIVDQLCINWIYTNLLGIHGTGATTGVDQRADGLSGGFWAPLIFKLGAIYFPQKYERYYYQFVANEMYYRSNIEGGAQENFANYYAYNFGYCTVFGFLLIEDPNTNVWKNYFKGFYNSLWTYTRYHRNAWFNAAFLMICHEAGLRSSDVGEDLQFIADDIGDQLQRFGESHSPNLNSLLNNVLPDGYELIQPVKEFVERLGLNAQVQRLLGIEGDEEFVNKPLTIDLYDADGWPWNNNSFKWALDDSEDLLKEYVGSGFTVPYWMLRYMDYLEGGTT